MQLSVVVPCYNEEAMIVLFYQETQKELQKLNINYELIFVDDGSIDGSLSLLKNLNKKDNTIKIISFSRNFGKEAAMLAGLEKATGDYVVIMDADLQNPPHLLKDMLIILKTNEYDCVAAYRKSRGHESIFKSIFSKLFYKIANLMTDIKMAEGVSDYRMMNQSVVKSLLSMKEYHRFTKGMFAWVGYKTKYLTYDNVNRQAGRTKWSIIGLFKYAFSGIISFTILPLRIVIFLGLLTILTGLIYTIIVIINGNVVSGSIIISMLLFLGGCQLLVLGIIGEYLGRTYYETKRRPHYIIKEYISYDK